MAVLSTPPVVHALTDQDISYHMTVKFYREPCISDVKMTVQRSEKDVRIYFPFSVGESGVIGINVGEPLFTACVYYINMYHNSCAYESVRND